MEKRVGGDYILQLIAHFEAKDLLKPYLGIIWIFETCGDARAQIFLIKLKTL